jgi:hypothetical protein
MRKRRLRGGRIEQVRKAILVHLQVWKHPGYQDKQTVSMMELKRFQTRYVTVEKTVSGHKAMLYLELLGI